MRNQVQLITYVDRLSGGGFRDLRALLRGPLAGLFGGVHVLPFYDPIDGVDAGYDPIDHTRVDRRLGTWDDLCALGAELPVMADLIVNHISARSPQFVDFSAHGATSPYAEMFLTRERVFPAGPTPDELGKIFRPRPGPPFTKLQLANGDEGTFWTTFTPQQIDIDVYSAPGAAYVRAILDGFQAAGIQTIRLDAAGYAVKKAGTSCFMIPETFDFIAAFSRDAHERGMEVLVEIHCHYSKQIEIARHVDRVYDFALPPLVLHALFAADAQPLKQWLSLAPRNCVTVLDTHDGIGVIDAGADHAEPGRPGLLSPGQLDVLVETIHVNSKGGSRLATGEAASNLDLYQVNCSYYSALACDDSAYLLARAIQFFAPGIPQVYYVGLLAGPNDMDLLAQTGVGRDINRHFYTAAEVAEALERPVVCALAGLIRFRNSHPAFDGAFSIEPSAAHELRLRWQHHDAWATLTVNLRTRTGWIHTSGQPACIRLHCEAGHLELLRES